MRSRTVNVLLIEDDSDDIYLAQSALKQDPLAQYAIVICSKIKDLDHISDTHWDVVLLDLNLPDSNGLKTLTLVLNRFSYCPVIVMTGLQNEEIGEKAIQQGAEDYLPKHELTASLLSRSIRFAIERHSLVNKLRNMALVDSLTLLANRADFDTKLEATFEQCHRHKQSFALFLMDLNKFKEINDTYGHQAGDQALMQTATRLKQRCRKSDYLARIGGDEFALIVPTEASPAACERIARDFIQCVEEPILVYTDKTVQEVRLGISIGISLYPSHATSLSELIKSADNAMYQAKTHSPSSTFHFGSA